MMKLSQSSEKLYCIAFLMIIFGKVDSQIPTCQNYMSYNRYNGKETIGIIKLNPPPLNTVFKVDISLSASTELPSDYIGTFTLAGTNDEKVEKVKNGFPLIFEVRFPEVNPLPKLTSMTVNGQQICYGSQDRDVVTTFEFTRKINITSSIEKIRYTKPTTNIKPDPRKTFPNTHSNIPPTERMNLQSQYQEPLESSEMPCGIVETAIPLTYYGTNVERGSLPWLAAILKHTSRDDEFICGGNLVSSRAVVTSAHCVIQDGRISQEQFIVELGRYNRLINSEYGMKRIGIHQIIAHPDFQSGKSYDADIAVLVLRDRFEYSAIIRPICLPHQSRNIVGYNGTVAGWGTTETGGPSFVPLKVENQPIVSESECVKSAPSFTNLISSRTFCAGDKSGIGPCTGDSGGGFGVLINGRWTLYGTVSAALNMNQRCYLYNFVIYSNVYKFMNWLQNYI